MAGRRMVTLSTMARPCAFGPYNNLNSWKKGLLKGQHASDLKNGRHGLRHRAGEAEGGVAEEIKTSPCSRVPLASALVLSLITRTRPRTQSHEYLRLFARSQITEPSTGR